MFARLLLKRHQDPIFPVVSKVVKHLSHAPGTKVCSERVSIEPTRKYRERERGKEFSDIIISYSNSS